jgi:putative transposon-encoded protein
MEKIKKESSQNCEQQTEYEISDKVKFEVYGHEMIEKIVKISGNSGRLYVPPDWVGHTVKIVKVD